MATDVELYEEQLKRFGDDPKGGTSAPDLTEVGLLESLVMGMTEQLQVLTHLTAKQKGKPKVKELPRPKTAAQLYKKAKAREAVEHLEGVIKFVSREEFVENTKKGGEGTFGHVLRR